MNNQPEDKDLNQYLKGGTELSQLYQTTMNQEPPSSLDQMILRAAKSAAAKTKASKTSKAPAETKPGFLSRLFNVSWIVPVASLASFAVIAVMVAVLVSSPETGGDRDDTNIAQKTKASNGTQMVNSTNEGKKVGSEGLQTVSHMTSKSSQLPATAALWISKIKSLHKQGKLDAAKTSFSLFQKKHPKYSVDKLKQALKDTGLVN